MNDSFPPTASQLAAAIRAGELTAVDAVETYLDRIARLNPPLNAVVTIDAAGARRQAREADEARERGVELGPLHGVPITVKDSFDTAGLRTTAGFPPFAARVPGEDAPPVARLRAAGAIVLGKTNLPTLASGIQTDNPVFGRTNNPWDVARTPGGSSGGSAAAVAAGLTSLDLGSDIGGSIRIPAHFCGVYGLKATGGRVVGKGHVASPRPLAVPKGWEGLLGLASFGPLARSVDDLRLALQVIASPASPPLEAPSPRALADLRIVLTDDFGGTPITADTGRRLADLAAGLERAGCRVERRSDVGLDFDEAWHVAGTCLGAINTLFQSPFTRTLRRIGGPLLSRFGPRDPLMSGLFAGMALRPAIVEEAFRRREALSEKIEALCGAFDAWICPAFPSPAFTHRAPNAPVEVDDARLGQLAANLRHSIVFNLTGHPVVTLPIGLSGAGLPIGVQVVGRRWREMALLDVAGLIDRVAGGYRTPPGY